MCISGNNAVDSAAIADALQTIGVCEGARAAKIDPEEKRNELLLEMKELSWAAINIEGSRVTVDVIETKFEDEKDTAPSNLKAGYDGIVRKIEVIKGVASVKVGDAVRKGDLLVSGMHEYSDQTTDLTRARGKIYAEVNQSFRVAQPLTVTEYLKTGETDERSVLRFFGLDIPLFLVKSPVRLNRKRRREIFPTENPICRLKFTQENFLKPAKQHILLPRSRQSGERCNRWKNRFPTPSESAKYYSETKK